MTLLSINSDPKTSKGVAHGYLTGICYMTPHQLPDHGNVCPKASTGCAAECLAWQGRGNMTSVAQARLARRILWSKHPDLFIEQLTNEIDKLVRRAARAGLTPLVRLNGTSDIVWEKRAPALFSRYPDLIYYDYTKIPGRNPPANYHLTFSRSESNDRECHAELARGRSVAVVYTGEPPARVLGARTVDGDTSDLRHLDPPGRVVLLRAKGRAKHDDTGFVLHF